MLLISLILPRKLALLISTCAGGFRILRGEIGGVVRGMTVVRRGLMGEMGGVNRVLFIPFPKVESGCTDLFFSQLLDLVMACHSKNARVTRRWR